MESAGRGQPSGERLFMANSTKIMALPAVVDLDSLDVVRDGLIDAVETGPVEINAAAVERVATNALAV